jgi:hypothetical protein
METQARNSPLYLYRGDRQHVAPFKTGRQRSNRRRSNDDISVDLNLRKGAGDPITQIQGVRLTGDVGFDDADRWGRIAEQRLPYRQ